MLRAHEYFIKNPDEYTKLKQLVETDEDANLRLVIQLLQGLDLWDLSNWSDFYSQKTFLRTLFDLKPQSNTYWYYEQTINWGGGRLRELPPKLLEMNYLRFLDVRHNQLAYLPVEMNKLSYLQFLIAYKNQIPRIPESLGDLDNLRVLNLSNNCLQELPETLVNCTLLRVLNVYANQIYHLPDFVNQFKYLNELNVSFNHLTYLKLDNLPQLRRLFAVGNGLKKISIAPDLPSKLEKLHLHHNQLHNLPESIGNLYFLRELHLYNNQLTELPQSIQNLKRLEHLTLQKNPFSETEKQKIKKYLPHTKIEF
jgi:leucine-rich repeat protein SHOC2